MPIVRGALPPATCPHFYCLFASLTDSTYLFRLNLGVLCASLPLPFRLSTTSTSFPTPSPRSHRTVNPAAVAKAVVQLVEERGLVDRTIVQSFDHRSLWAVRRLNPNIRLSALTERGRFDPLSYAGQGAAIWSPQASTLTPALIQATHKAGLAVIPWTVNDPDDMQRLIDLGVDGLITDRPDLLLALLAQDAGNQ